MRRGFYARLALGNIRKNAETYFPYVLASSATVMMFYDILFLLFSREVLNMRVGGTLLTVLFLGAIVTGFFAFILLLYINSFVIKRRKKEFGLFNILGMEKRHIARIMLLETVFVGLLCIALGLAAGILFSKIALLLLLRILKVEPVYGFEVPVEAAAITVLYFGAVFLLNLIYNVFQVYRSKPVELLKGGNVGEKEPGTKWLIALSGAAALASGYYIAITTKSPIAALGRFFTAVLLVIAGTYGLFTAGSIAILKMLRKNKKIYYRTNPFIAVSGMIYRMKQNAAGLASICILSTAVIIMLSSTVSLYVGLEDVLRTQYIREITVSAYDTTDEQIRELAAAVTETVKREGLDIRNPVAMRYVSQMALQDGSSFTGIRTAGYSFRNAALLMFMTAEEYNRLEGGNVQLAEGEAMVYVIKGKIPGDTMDLNGQSLRIRGYLDSFKTLEQFLVGVNRMMAQNYVVITANEQDLFRVYESLIGEKEGYTYNYLFDTGAGRETQLSLVSALKERLKDLRVDGYASGREEAREAFLSIYGVLFFLGLFLGTLFILGTVLIIYYKQISEGYDDKARFTIMRKVGLSHDEVKKAIRFQVLSVFFLPLVMAVIHIAAAFPAVSRLLALLNLNNVPLYALCTALTILVFAVCYALIYMLTARTYYRIVRA
ncbi:MAG: cell division protein FtsX [Paenibacillaceae bacterium ZCTH02-B3]|nr:MAG: cell division protein FtsX [Paenibacillaceae bacterium ZCTH02-B3]